MIYQDWGFSENPFETSALPPNERGLKLLVGRDETIKALKRRLSNDSKLTTIEGINGIGKTSIVNVTAYQSLKEAMHSNAGQLFVPCRRMFQLSGSEDPSTFKLSVLIEVAQTLIDCHQMLPPRPGFTKVSNNSALDRYLNNPCPKSITVGIAGYSGGYTQELNTTVGFETSGLAKSIECWLAEIFPSSTSGGVVCTIDNLELLQTSQAARKNLEALRDSLFETRGIRWVLCGTLGVTRGSASSPRLDGRLHKPIIVEELEDRFAYELFDRRVKVFKSDRHARLPLTSENFRELYDIMRGNIRGALSEADEFCNWVADQVEDIDEFEANMFEEWLETELEEAYNAVRSELRPAALRAFETACQYEVFSPSDCTAFGYATPNAMRPQIQALEAIGLLVSAVDDADKRRKTIQVTAKGWKVRAHLDRIEPA